MSRFKPIVVENNNYSISFCGLLTLLFIGLKLSNIITWSWWWVLSPVWIPCSIMALVLTVALVLVTGKKRR